MQSKILNFRISSPKNARKVEFFDDSILIKEPCILGQTVEAFVHFPSQTTKERGVHSCFTDGFLSRAILGTGKSGEEVISMSQALQDLTWPDKQQFIIYIMPKTLPLKANTEKFLELL